MVFEPFQQLLRSIQGKRGGTGGLGEVQNAQQIAFLRGLQKEIQPEEALAIPLSELKVVVFDIETTGFHPEKGDEILSIGAIKMNGSQILQDETYYSLMHTTREIPLEVTKLTSITNEAVSVAPSAATVLIEFFDFVQDYTLVAHHAQHERSFMKYASMHYFRTPFKYRIVDTTFLFKIVERNLNIIKLEDYCMHNHMSIINRHHALGDAKLTAQLWSLYVEKAKKIGCENLQDVYDRYARQQ